MSLGFLLYLATVSDKLGFIAGGLSVVLTLIGSILAMLIISSKQEILKNTISLEKYGGDNIHYKERVRGSEADLKLFLSIFRPTAAVLTISILIAVFLPKSKDLYIIYGANVVEDVVKSPKVQETGGKVLDLINKKLSELLEK